METKKVKALYCRVSSYTQQIQGQVEEQIAKCNTAYKLFQDDGISGTIPFESRKAGAALLAAAERGQISEVVVYDVSRLGRRAESILATVDRFHSMGIGVRVLKYNFCTMEDGKLTPLGDFLIGIYASLSQQFYHDQRESVMLGIERAKKLKLFKGRQFNTEESPEKFLAKPRVKKALELIDANVGVRCITRALSCSSNFVYKVKRIAAEQREVKATKQKQAA